MTLQPPGPPQAAPPPVADRRAPERRSGYDRRAEERADVTRVAVASAMAICGGLALLFVFFWALGAIDVKNAVASTVVAVAFAGVWVAGLLYRRRTIGHDPDAHRTELQDRERRGF